MKKILTGFLPWLFLAFGYKAVAQEEAPEQKERREAPEQKEKKEAEEIVIRKKGSKDVNLNIQITGDKVVVNGKPLVEFKDNEITVNKRKVIVRDGNEVMFGDLGEDFDNGNFSWDSDENKSSAFLGVTTEKAPDGAKIIEDVAKGTAAGRAGLEKADIITKIGDKRIDGPGALFEAVNSMKPKDEITITYKRNGKEKNTKAVLGERKNSFTKTYTYRGPNGSYKSYTMPAVPRTPQPPHTWNGDDYNALITPEIQDELNNIQMDIPGFSHRPKLGLKIQDTEDGGGVRILEVEDSSAAAVSGLKNNDVITEIAGVKVTNTDEAREQLQENRDKGTYQVKARRNGTEMKFDIKIPKKLKTANL